jgi:hypothetical protein
MIDRDAVAQADDWINGSRPADQGVGGGIDELEVLM